MSSLLKSVVLCEFLFVFLLNCFVRVWSKRFGFGLLSVALVEEKQSQSGLVCSLY